MDRRYELDPLSPGAASPPPQPTPGSPWGAAPAASGEQPSAPRDPWNGAWRQGLWRRTLPFAEAPPPPGTGSATAAPLSTPLVWIGGGVLLTATLWLASVIALVRAV